MNEVTVTDVPKFRTGDHVRHKPSGEVWSVAYADHEKGVFSAAGWPDELAQLSDVELVKAATDEEHLLEVAAWKKIPGERRAMQIARLYPDSWARA